MIGNAIPERGRFVHVPIAPHLLFFWIYNLIYFVPLVATYTWGYAQGGAVEAIALDSRSFSTIVFVYVEGLFAFTLGSIFTKYLLNQVNGQSSDKPYQFPTIGVTEQIGIVLIVAAYIAAKAALVPLGFYNIYAFNLIESTNGVWSLSMAFAEFLLLCSTLVLLSKARHNALGYAALSFLNGVNLLHGTRIIFIVNLMVTVLYLYLRGIFTLRRMLIIGPFAFLAVLLLAYAVFLSRSGASGSLTAAAIISPIVYESLFSQLSLRNVVNSPEIMNSTGTILNFIVDMALGSMPRILVPDKDALQYVDQFAYLSPLGAFNGYAAGLIYFGVFWPIFYLLLGGMASWLYVRAKTNPYWLVLYAYFTGDVLFRFMRDGYTIPIKILINIVELLVVLLTFRALMRGLAPSGNQRLT
jgi:hypothetical protein